MTTSGDRQTLNTNGKTAPRAYVGPVRVSLTGTFGGGTLKIQAEDPTAVFVDVDGTAKTAVGDFVIDFPPSAENRLQADLSGATSPTLVIWIQGAYRGA